MNRILITLSFFVLSAASFAQFDYINITLMESNDKLPVGEITQVFQDSEGFIWYGTNDGLCRDDGYEIHMFKKNVFKPETPDISTVYSIAEDQSNHLWVGTAHGLIRLDKQTFGMSWVGDPELHSAIVNYLLCSADGTIWAMGTKHLYHISSDARILKKYKVPEGISCIYEDSKQRLFISRNGYGLMLKRADNDKFQLVAPFSQISIMIEDSVHECYWLCDRFQGFYKYVEKGNGRKEMLKAQTHTGLEPGNFITHIVQDDHYHYLWVLSYYNGLLVYRVNENGDLEKVPTDSFIPASNHILYSIMKARNGHLWITGLDMYGFIVNIDKQGSHFNPLDELKRMNNFNPVIMAIFRDSGGIFWLMQKRNDLYLYDPKAKACVSTTQNSVDGLPLYMTEQLCTSHKKNCVWANLSGSSVCLLEREGMRVKLVEKVQLSDYDIKIGSVSHLYEDSKSNLWIGTTSGICVLRHATHNIELISGSVGEISDIAESHDGNLWCTVRNKGLIKVDKRGKITLFPLPLDLTTVAVTSDGISWVGCREGRVYRFDETQEDGKKFADYTQHCGIDLENIGKIITDCFDHLWIITSQQVKEYNPVNMAFRVISAFDKPEHMMRFIPQSTFVDRSDNQIYIGGVPGFLSIYPSQTLENVSKNAKVQITDVWVNGQSVWFDSANHQKTGELIISPDDHNINIFFSSLDFSNIKNIRYSYKLEGIDDEWIYIDGGNNVAVYNRLPKGKFVFKVRATNANGLWCDTITEFKIIRTPDWYESDFAYVIYVLLFIIIIVMIIKWYKHFFDNRNQKILNENIIQAKMVYFTSISHELLTPLTIIKCIADEISFENDDNKQKIELIKANVERLRRLFQQVLDFRKVESKNMKLYVEEGNITAFLQALCKESFEPLARNKNIQFLTTFPIADIIGYFDRDKLEKILFNIVSNAFKYTPNGRSVTLTAKLLPNNHLWLSVKDEGVGIDPREQKFIFNRFYSSKKNNNSISNGIGLSLTKDFVELHHGTITVESQSGKGADFIVDLPVDKESFTADEIKEVAQDEQIEMFKASHDKLNVSTDVDKEKENLLIVEDNLELLSVMQSVLSKKYNVFVATNGYEALDVIRRENIQIVISDISMPKMDGIELCKRIKQNINTSHLIFVLLTARINSQSQIEAYNAGADAYLTKPFETEILLTLLTNLKTQRERNQQKFLNNIKENDVNELDVSELDKEFINSAINVVENNLDNPQLDVEFLASELNMSRSTLSRKLKAVTGQTAFEFIKSLRLKFAYRLLQSHKKTVVEVMERVGYLDHRTFTQSFKDMFGILPSELK